MKSLLNWLAAAASLLGLYFTLKPVADTLSTWQNVFLVVVTLIFIAAALHDLYEEHRRAAKRYKNPAAINKYMYAMLRDS